MIKFGIYSKLRRLIPDLAEMRAPRNLVAPSGTAFSVELLFTQANKGQLVVRSAGGPVGERPGVTMILTVDFASHTALAAAYQDGFGYRRVQPDDHSVTNQATADGLNLFLDQWLSDLLVSSYTQSTSK
ncbi:hypothetical protein IGB42_03227 [Andreprevotia sp. IGB-42]|uniref:hypothetical protein n=1 Tax=Andreprevotia sp. IGB-42 TaxID=2497473 RepID=UPI00135C1330|nr:hypothetical protein [Andreprevotia sp. IGB-42]KAF0812237.1 hypothetical protein IGB42_03227 [Andreprevotia sp. IGB-42]